MALLEFITATCIGAGASAATVDVIETRTVELTQTVTLTDIPADAKNVRLWVPIPTDTVWQRVLDCRVVAAPGAWELVRQSEGRGEFIYVDFESAGASEASVVVDCIVERQGVHFPLSYATARGAIQPELFEAQLDLHAPLMEPDDRVRAMAARACGDETDIARQAQLLLEAVKDAADHYSKNDNVPTCGRGAAGDCLDHGGGCCTDLHSLFVALARERGIPARILFGYRLLDGREGKAYDPGYRCWVEYFVPGSGWVPTDIVASEGAGPSDQQWGSLSSTRVTLWEGRSFELTPPARAGRIDTMLKGWAEIDGVAVDPLPADDGTPSKVGRTVEYRVLSNDRTAETPALPQ